MRPSRFFLMVSAQAALLAVAPLPGFSTGTGWLFPIASAQEQPAPAPDYEAAKQHYQKAEQAAAKSEWSTAAKEYGIAYEITRDAVLFFKLGNAYQLSGDCTRAVEYFERYLKEANPSEEYARDTQERIHECQSGAAASATTSEGGQKSGDVASDQRSAGDSPLAPRLAEDTGSDDLPPGEQPSFIEEEVTWQQTAAWSSVGLTVAFLSASAVLGLSASSREEDLNNLLRYTDSAGRPARFDSTVRSRYEDLQDEGDEFNSLSMVALGLAGASAAAAVVFFLLDDSVDEDSEGSLSLAPTIGGDSFGVHAGYRF